MVKLIFRILEYDVRSGMTLVDSLKKNNTLLEGPVCTRDEELISEG